MVRVVILKFSVATGRAGEFEAMVAERVRTHRGHPGFLRMYLLRPAAPADEYRCVAWWSHLANPESWIRTETYALSEDRDHAGIVVGPVANEVLEVVGEF